MAHFTRKAPSSHYMQSKNFIIPKRSLLTLFYTLSITSVDSMLPVQTQGINWLNQWKVSKKYLKGVANATKELVVIWDTL